MSLSGHPTLLSFRRPAVAVAIAMAAALLAPLPASAGGVTPGTTPTITAPTGGATVTQNVLTVTASSAATHVKFVVDARPGDYTKLVAVSGNEASAQFPMPGLKGLTLVQAFDCEVGGSCNIVGDEVSVTVDLVAPVITSPTDGQVVKDTVTVEATAPGGSLMFFLSEQLKGLDDTAPYRLDISLGRKSDGKYLASVRQCNVAGDVCEGKVDKVLFIKDTHGPKFTDLGTTQRTVFPVKDQYKDTTRLSAKVGEASQNTRVEIRKAGGPLVRTLKIGQVGRGRISATWNGRKSNGAAAPKGKYIFRFVGTDKNGVTGRSNDKVVYVSDKRLVKRDVTKTVSGWGSKVDSYAGKCSSVVRVGSGTVSLRSNSKRTCTGDASIAATIHTAFVGKAVKYGNLRVSVYGSGKTANAPTAVLVNVRPNGQAGAKTRLGGSLRWTAGDSVSLNKYIKRGRVYWALVTGGSNSYDARQFKVAYTVWVLQ